MLERVDVEGDRDRREVRRDVRLIDDDPLDPAGAVRRDLAATQVAVGDGLLQQRPQEIEHVLAARHHALVHEELGRRLHGHGLLLRGTRVGRERGDGIALPGRPEGSIRGQLAARAARDGFEVAYDRAVLLAIDIGNSNVTIGSFRNGSLTAVRRAATPRGTTPDELEVLLEDLLRLDDAAFADVSAIACASVVPAVTDALEAVAARRERPLLIAGAGTVPIPIRTDRPGDVGADRLVNALAVSRLYGTPAVVVDLGTATTFDCVAHDGAFVGGAIAAGHRARPRRARVADREAPAGGAASFPIGRSGGTPPPRSRAAPSSATRRSSRACSCGSDASSPTRATSRSVTSTSSSRAGWRFCPGRERWRAIEAIDPELTLKGLAILHAEVAGGQPLELPLT